MKSWHVPQRILDAAQGVVRHPEPPVPSDLGAGKALFTLVRAAADELAELHPSLVAVASAPNRFNDVSFYGWHLVRVGDRSIEHDEYDGTLATYRREVAAATPAVRSAAAVLDRLEKARWRHMFQQAFELPFNDEFVAVVVQHKLPWFVYASSNLSGREHVFGLWTDELRYFGECVERTDDELIDERGLVFWQQRE